MTDGNKNAVFTECKMFSAREPDFGLARENDFIRNYSRTYNRRPALTYAQGYYIVLTYPAAIAGFCCAFKIPYSDNDVEIAAYALRDSLYVSDEIRTRSEMSAKNVGNTENNADRAYVSMKTLVNLSDLLLELQVRRNGSVFSLMSDMMNAAERIFGYSGCECNACEYNNIRPFVTDGSDYGVLSVVSLFTAVMCNHISTDNRIKITRLFTDNKLAFEFSFKTHYSDEMLKAPDFQRLRQFADNYGVLMMFGISQGTFAIRFTPYRDDLSVLGLKAGSVKFY